MTRIDALTQLTSMSTPALLQEMNRRGYAGDGNLDDVNAYVARWLDRIAKTSAATLARFTDWRQVLDHASGKGKAERSASTLPEDIRGVGFTVQFSAPADRIQIVFDKFPPAAVREVVKASGFYWAPSVKMWQRKITTKGIRAAQDAAQQIAQLHML